MLRKLGTAPAVARVSARINAPITARLGTKPAFSGNAWKISVVGTRNTSSKEAPNLVLGPKTKRIDPALNTTIAATSRMDASGSGIPREAMKSTVAGKPVNLAGMACAKRNATKARPTKSKAFNLSAAKNNMSAES